VEIGKHQSKATIGFLTVIDNPQHGLFGGYLVLNLAARPLEFHCTTPIKPNRAQQILYGPTLESFLFGEQIGLTLLGQSKTSPILVCTDREPVMSLAAFVDLPVALVLPPEEQQSGNTAPDSAGEATRVLRVDAPHQIGPRLKTFELGRNRLALTQEKGQDPGRLGMELGEKLGVAAESLDLWEPFSRIREAIEEAQQGYVPK
jgi:hypothetical protein